MAQAKQQYPIRVDMRPESERRAGTKRAPMFPAASSRAMGGVTGGVMTLVGALTGTNGADTTVRPYRSPAPVEPLRKRQVGDQVLLAGGTPGAPRRITAQDKLLAHIDTLLSGGVTMRDLQTIGGLMPVAAPAAKQQSAKDAALGEVANVSQAIFQNQISQAQELSATDPEAARAMTSQAMNDYFQRGVSLSGANPLALAQAQMFPPPEEE